MGAARLGPHEPLSATDAVLFCNFFTYRIESTLTNVKLNDIFRQFPICFATRFYIFQTDIQFILKTSHAVIRSTRLQ